MEVKKENNECPNVSGAFRRNVDVLFSTLDYFNVSLLGLGATAQEISLRLSFPSLARGHLFLFLTITEWTKRETAREVTTDKDEIRHRTGQQGGGDMFGSVPR